MKKVILLATVLVFTGCTQPEKAEKLLKQHGFSEVEITGWKPFIASKGEVFSTGFRAKAQNGETVEGAVTGGILKGSTIRFE